jgi:flagellar biosynthetic protein FlhB
VAEAQGQEKTEQPTAKRLEEARERGQVPKSQDLTAAVTLLCAMVVLYFMGLPIARKLVATVRIYLGGEGVELVGGGALNAVGRPALRLLGETVAPLLLLVLASALVILYVQVGWLVTLKPLKPKFNKLNPISGVKRLFGLSSLVKLGMSSVKTAVATLVAVLTIGSETGHIVGASALHEWAVLGLGGALLFKLALRVSLVLLLLALLDYAYQRWKHKQDLKMTKQEVKEELRQMEGDPVVRRRQRNVQFQLALQRIRSAVPRADVVITNPTQLAVAIRYDAEVMAAPKVIAKGKGYVAQRIREIALECGIPLVERKPLAQALYKAVEVGQEIPPQFYKALAEILAYVYELSGRRRRPVAAGA